MSAIKTIRTRNLQSHEDVLIELPETGVVVFSGDNSNGKSVLTKVISATLDGGIRTSRKRRTLVRRAPGVHEGTLAITKYDGSKLLVCINIEAAQTYVEYTDPSQKVIRRFLSDKTYVDLVKEFGFHYNEKRDISINIFDSEDSLLFFRTNHVTNGDILETALTDDDARTKYDVLSEQYKSAQQMRRTFEDNIRVAQAAKDAITLYDITEEETRRDALYKCSTILSNFYLPNLKEVPVVPSYVYINLPKVRLHKGEFPAIIPLPSITLRDLGKICRELDEIEKGVCPTCKRPLAEHQHS